MDGQVPLDSCRDRVAEADALAAAGHVAAAVKLLLPEAAAGNHEARFLLIEIALRRQRGIEAMGHAQEILRGDALHARARLRLAEAQLMLGQFDLALTALPHRAHPGEEMRLLAAATRARLRATRKRGEQLWAAGAFCSGRELYQRLHDDEEKVRDEFRAVLDRDPGNVWAWQVLLDAVNNYRLSFALNQAQPDPAAMRRAYLEAVTGNPDHVAQNYHAITVTAFKSVAKWPQDDVVATLLTPPRRYLPSRFGQEKPVPVPASTVPRHVIRLRECFAYDAGTFLWLTTPEGYAPWLYEGVWGPYIHSKLMAFMPPPYHFFENEGLGTALTVVPPPTLRIDDPVVVLGYWNNYGHFLHDVLPQLEDAETALGRDFKILVVDALLPTIREALARAGYGAERLVSIGECRSAIIREAYCLTPRTILERVRRFNTPMLSEFWHYDMALDDAGIAFVRQRLRVPAADALKPPTRRIYTSRRNIVRSPHNERQLEAMLAAQGYEIIVPDHLTLADQIAMFADTRTLVALEGASLANMMFMQPGTDVVVLRSTAWNWTVNCFDELARIGGIKLHVVDFPGREFPLELLQGRLPD